MIHNYDLYSTASQQGIYFPFFFLLFFLVFRSRWVGWSSGMMRQSRGISRWYPKEGGNFRRVLNGREREERRETRDERRHYPPTGTCVSQVW